MILYMRIPENDSNLFSELSAIVKFYCAQEKTDRLCIRKKPTKATVS
jgi:hypothetical protein